jgi:hypothetical protein
METVDTPAKKEMTPQKIWTIAFSFFLLFFVNIEGLLTLPLYSAVRIYLLFQKPNPGTFLGAALGIATIAVIVIFIKRAFILKSWSTFMRWNIALAVCLIACFLCLGLLQFLEFNGHINGMFSVPAYNFE